jgi:hypothetical protein
MQSRAPYRIPPITVCALSPRGISDAFGIPYATVRAAIRSGLLPAWKAPSGKAVRCLISDCEAFVRANWTPYRGSKKEKSHGK